MDLRRQLSSRAFVVSILEVEEKLEDEDLVVVVVLMVVVVHLVFGYAASLRLC